MAGIINTLIKRTKARVWEGMQGKLPWNARITYSQFGEDAILNWLTREQVCGFYVDIGAYHPVALSNTYSLYLRGWNGLCIEARSDVLREFQLYRPRDISVSCCIDSAASENAVLFEFVDPAFTTLDVTTADQNRAAGLALRRSVPVEVIAINDALDRWVPTGTAIDVLSIDVEGLDERILRSLDFSRYSPRILVFERHGLNLEKLVNCDFVGFLRNQGYEARALCGPSVIMTK